MPRGPAPTPTATLKMRGSWRAKSRQGEPKPEVEAPVLPETMDTADAYAAEEFERVTDAMVKLGIAAQIDLALTMAYCQVFGRWRFAEDQLTKQGAVIKTLNGHEIQNPWLAIANTCIGQMRGLAQELGLSPSARTRIKVTPQPPADDDEFERFLDGEPPKKGSLASLMKHQALHAAGVKKRDRQA